MDTASREGMEKGRVAEKIRIAKQMKEEKIPLGSISRITGLSMEEVNNL